MTEERFTVLYGIDDNPFEWDIVDNQKNAIIKQDNGIAICNKLNELNDENKELKRNYDLCVHRRMNDHNEVHRLEDENNELKDFKQKVFDLINKQIEEYHQSEKDCSWGDPDRFTSYQIALIGLREALQE